MAATAGRLVVWLGLNSDPLLRGFAGASRAQQAWAAQASSVTARQAQGFAKLAQAVERTVLSFETGGLEGAVRGGAEKITAFIGAINPVAGAVAASALAITSLLVPAFTSAGEEAEVAKEHAAEFRQELDRLLKTRAEQRQFLDELRQQQTSEGAGRVAAGVLRNLDEVRDELGLLERLQREKFVEAKAFLPEEFIFDRGDAPLGREHLDALQGEEGRKRAVELLELETRINEKRQERLKLLQRLTVAERERRRLLDVEDKRDNILRAQEEFERRRRLMEEERKLREESARGVADLARDLEKRLHPRAAERREIEERVFGQLRDLERFQMLGAVDRQQFSLLQQQVLRAGAKDLARLDRLDRPAERLPEALQRGSAEAFRIIAQQQAQRSRANPNARLEQTSNQQLAELRRLREAVERMRTHPGTVETVPP